MGSPYSAYYGWLLALWSFIWLEGITSGCRKVGRRINNMNSAGSDAENIPALSFSLCRITVRVVYSTGESEDSNSIIASLDSSQPPQLREEPQQHHNGSTSEGKQLPSSFQHLEPPPRGEGKQPPCATNVEELPPKTTQRSSSEHHGTSRPRAEVEQPPKAEGELPRTAAESPNSPQRHLSMGESEPEAVTTDQFHYQWTGKSHRECAANLDATTWKPDPDLVDPGDRVQARARHQACGDRSHLSSDGSGAHDKYATDPSEVDPGSLDAKDHMSKKTSGGTSNPGSTHTAAAATATSGGLEMDPPDTQGVVANHHPGLKKPDPLASEGHLIESGEMDPLDTQGVVANNRPGPRKPDPSASEGHLTGSGEMDPPDMQGVVANNHPGPRKPDTSASEGHLIIGSGEVDPPATQGGVVASNRPGLRHPDPLGCGGHLMGSGWHELVKPCLSKPSEERPTAGRLQCGTTLLSSTSSSGNAAGPSVPFSSFESPQEDVGLRQPITTRSLISGTISSPSLPPVHGVSMGSTEGSGGDGGSSSSVLCGIECEPSAGLNEALMYQTKQGSPLAITAVPTVAAIGLFHHHTAPIGVGGLTLSTSTVCVPAWSIGVSGAGTVHQATDLHTGSVGSEVTGFTPKADTGIGNWESGLELTIEGTDGGGNSSSPRDTVDVPGGMYGSEGTTKLTDHLGGTVDLTGGKNSTIVREDLCPPGGSSDVKDHFGSGTSNDNSTTWCQELARESRSDISERQAECKQTEQLSSHLEKCFEVSKETLPLPKRGSDSIISLVETTASSACNTDSTQGSKPPRQTMPLLLFEQDHRTLCPFISEGGSDKAEGMGSLNEPDGMASSSTKMASILLSQLESDLTNSLTEDNSN